MQTATRWQLVPTCHGNLPPLFDACVVGVRDFPVPILFAIAVLPQLLDQTMHALIDLYHTHRSVPHSSFSLIAKCCSIFEVWCPLGGPFVFPLALILFGAKLKLGTECRNGAPRATLPTLFAVLLGHGSNVGARSIRGLCFQGGGGRGALPVWGHAAVKPGRCWCS